MFDLRKLFQNGIIYPTERKGFPMSEPVFKPCMQNQPMLFPPDVSDLIPANAMVRAVDSIVNSLDRKTLTDLYPGGGASAYDPFMMLKVVLYSYAKGIYSSRKIAQATREDVNLLWLTGMHPLEHNTVNRFRSARIRPVFEQVFTSVILLLADAGMVDLDTYFLDGTKIEANAGKFTFVWSRSTDRYTERLRAKVHAHLQAIDELNDEEEALAPEEPETIDAEKIRQAADEINRRLREKGESKDPGDKAEAKELRRAERAFRKDYLPRMEKYERQAEVLDGRSSYSKTDHDATFMRMKDDHMGNGQLKAGYNVQVGTFDQFIICSTLHRRPGDTACAIPHLEHLRPLLGRLPRNVVADAGYGSEENYAYLQAQGVNAYVKHGEFFREIKNPKWRNDPFRPANWAHDEATDAYACPEGRRLEFQGVRSSKSDLGFVTEYRKYRCSGCDGCPSRKECMKNPDSKYGKTLQVNERLRAFKEKASAMLCAEPGISLRKKRAVDVETVFGDIKRNMGFTRFTLRGLAKAELEFRLIAMGHNIRKMMRAMEKAGA